jgi:curli biogenesis system outer membrane secretion channel CsgG
MKTINGKFLAITAAVLLSVAVTGLSQRRSGESQSSQGGKPRVVVLAAASSGSTWTTNITTASLEDALTQSGRFELITAAQRDRLLSEQGFNNSDLVDPKQATKVGKLLSARFIIIGNALDVSASKRKVPKTGGLGGILNRSGINSGDELSADVKTKVQIQMIDAETGVVKLSKSYEEKTSKGSITKSRDDDDLLREGYRKAMESIASQFTQEIGVSVPVEGLVVFIRGGRVAIDLGSEQSVQVGQEFEVYSQDEPIKNAAGEVLSYVTTKYARLRVATVEPKLAWTTVVETYNENGSPDSQARLERVKVNYAVRQIK